MKYHKQRIIHDPENGQYGDCYQTAIACLFDLEQDDVPHFCDGSPSTQVFEKRVDRWLSERGVSRVAIGFHMAPDKLMEIIGELNPSLVYLISGASPRHKDVSHVVIAKGTELLHDPHPEGTGLAGPNRHGDSWMEFFVPTAVHFSP